MDNGCKSRAWAVRIRAETASFRCFRLFAFIWLSAQSLDLFFSGWYLQGIVSSRDSDGSSAIVMEMQNMSLIYRDMS